MSTIIEVENLSKSFGPIKAVNQLSFSVNSGEVYGFLGQNGAGKSTTIRMLLTLISPSGGSIKMFNQPLAQHRKNILKRVGAIIEKPDLYNYLTALENIKLLAKLSGCTKTNLELIKQLDVVGIGSRANSTVKTFSQGMKQRLGLACALIHNPQLIILDEPTNGLDPQGIADVRNLILHLSKNEGKTILVSSHLLSEIEVLADSMLIIDKGEKKAEGRAAQLLHPSKTRVELQTTNLDEALVKLGASSWSDKIVSTTGSIIFEMHQEQIPALTRHLVSADIDVVSLRPRRSLEDLFLSLTTTNQHVATYQA